MLAKIIGATDAGGSIFCGRQRGNQQARQNGYDGDYDQQFDESERARRWPSLNTVLQAFQGGNELGVHTNDRGRLCWGLHDDYDRSGKSGNQIMARL